MDLACPKSKFNVTEKCPPARRHGTYGTEEIIVLVFHPARKEDSSPRSPLLVRHEQGRKAGGYGQAQKYNPRRSLHTARVRSSAADNSRTAGSRNTAGVMLVKGVKARVACYARVRSTSFTDHRRLLHGFDKQPNAFLF